MHLTDAGFAVEFATASGKPVVLEMWAYPDKDAAVKSFHESIKAKMDAPTRIGAASLDGVAAIFIPGGHGAMVNLPKNAELGKLLHAAHEKAMPTITICHGSAALMAANCVEGKNFPYVGYKGAVFSDKTDDMTPKLGYMPGKVPFHVASSLAELGMQIKQSENGKIVVDRELIVADGPPASNKLGVTAVEIVRAYAKANNL